MTATMVTPRATYQTITVVQRYRVILKIVTLSKLLERGRNIRRGCCYQSLCQRDRVGYVQALKRLSTYAARVDAS